MFNGDSETRVKHMIVVVIVVVIVPLTYKLD